MDISTGTFSLILPASVSSEGITAMYSLVMHSVMQASFASSDFQYDELQPEEDAASSWPINDSVIPSHSRGTLELIIADMVVSRT